MNITLSALKKNPAKYFEIAKTADVIITKHGERFGRIVGEEKAARSERLNAFDELLQYVKTLPSVPDKIIYDKDREERLREKGVL